MGARMGRVVVESRGCGGNWKGWGMENGLGRGGMLKMLLGRG